MGRLGLNERIYESYGRCLVKNTFLDDRDLEDAPPPRPAELCRASTEPIPSCNSRASTDGSETPRSRLRDLGLSLPSSPQSTAEGLTPLCAAAAPCSPSRPAAPVPEMPALRLPPPALGAELDEDAPLPEGTPWCLTVKGTFLEYVWSRPTAARRSSSAGALDALRGAEAVEFAPAAPVCLEQASSPAVPEASPKAATPDAAEWPVLFVCQPPPMPQQPLVYDDPYSQYMTDGWWPYQASAPQTWPVDERCEPPAWTPRVDERMLGPELQGGRRRGRRREAPGFPAHDHDAIKQVIAEAVEAALEDRPGKVWDLAQRSKESSLLVQSAFVKVLKDLNEAYALWHELDWERYLTCQPLLEFMALLRDFRGHLVEALKHHHANHVVKLLMHDAHTDLISDIVAQELKDGNAVAMAKQNYGCRSILRLVRHCGHGTPASAAVEQVMQDVLDKAEELCCHEFGKFVIEELLRSRVPAHRDRALEALGRGDRKRLCGNAMHKHASGLIVQALANLDYETGSRLLDVLLEDPSMKALAGSTHGLYLLRDIAKHQSYRARVSSALDRHKPEARGSKAAKATRRLLQQGA